MEPIAEQVESWRTRLVGSNDLQGRESLQVTLKGDWCYVGHLPGHAPNPHTGTDEPNGTSILDVSDPTNPTLTHHIAAAVGANCRAVQVIHSPRDGRDYLIRNHETERKSPSVTAGGTPGGWEIFDISDRSNAVPVTRITSTPAGPISHAHKAWWDEPTGLFFASVGEPGFRPGGHLVIWDLSEPQQPTFVSRHWITGQHLSEPDPGPGASPCITRWSTWPTAGCTWAIPMAVMCWSSTYTT